MNQSAPISETVDFIFRQEWGKMVSVLTRLFGPGHLALAEDVVQDTLLKAMHSWKIHGIPENPSAWVFSAARNKAIDLLRKRQRELQHAPLLQSEYSLVPTVKEIVNCNHIDDDQLTMMFVCCHPALPAAAQIAIILRTLCGFSVKEIARAFICSYDTIEKRLYRARQTLQQQQIQFALPATGELNARLGHVLTAIYLLFNEGYNATHHEVLIRRDLMQEAIRLGDIICRSTLVDTTQAHALMALMYLNAARSDARLDAEGNLILLQQQQRSKWNQQQIARAMYHMQQSTGATSLSTYHLEASIAFEHTSAASYATTNWRNILHYYNLLYQLQPSPIVALNRAIVVGELEGAAAAIAAIEAIPDLESINHYYLLHATLANFYGQLHQTETAKQYYLKALQLTQSPAEQQLLQQKLQRMQ